MARPKAKPTGWPLSFSFLHNTSSSSYVSGNFSYPTSLHQSVRYTMAMGMIPQGTAFQVFPTYAMSRPMFVQPFNCLPRLSAMSLTLIRALSCKCAPSLQVVMMSGPAPLSTAAAVLVGRSVWLINSKLTSTPFSLVYCLACSRRVSSMAFRVLDQVKTLFLAAPSPLLMNVPKDRAAVAPAVTPRNRRRLTPRPSPTCTLPFRFSRIVFSSPPERVPSDGRVSPLGASGWSPGVARRVHAPLEPAGTSGVSRGHRAWA